MLIFVLFLISKVRAWEEAEVIINYAVAEDSANMGSVSPASETVKAETGTAAGSSDFPPLQGVHTLLLVDKPANILFEGDYDVNDTDKFRHKIILRSENKFLQPMRFSQEIDVETLSDEEEHLRAYYYPEGDDPVLFTPYQMLDKDII